MGNIQGILLVDDDFISNFLHQGILKKFGISHNVVDLTNGYSAIEYLKTCQKNSNICPELILLDIDMPVLNGFQFMKEFKQLSFANADRVQVVVLTVSNNPSDFVMMENLDVVSFITKPLTEEKLQKVLELHPAMAKSFKLSNDE